MSVYNELRLEQQLCDAVIRVDNVEFPVHKIILCNCSPYFIALFTRWSDSRVFDIPNVSPDIMKLIIEFAYTEFVPLTRGNVQELFVAADQFNVEGMIQAICHGLEEHLAPDNCISIWRLMDVYPELNHKAFLYTMNHFEEIALTSEEFLLLSVQELVKIIENDQLNVKHEKAVFAAILRWIACAIEERREYISLLLSNVRLAVTSVEYIAVSVSNNELVRGSKECRPILTRALHDLHTNIFSDSILYTPLARPRLPPAILLAVGGWNTGSPTNIIEAYDIRADRWVNVPNKEENIPRAYHGAVFLDGSVYCVGGFNGVEQFSSVHRFDLGTHTWQEVTQMHSRRSYLSTTVMDGCIYAMGGCDGHERLRSAERYQPRINQWNVIAPMHERRSDASCTTINGKVYICGGFNESGSMSTAECYDPETNQWTLIAPMSSRRSGLGVIVFADRIFAVGGFNGTSRLDTAEAYDPHTNTWHAVPSMLNSRSNFGIAVIDDRLFVAGGYGGSNTICEVECFDAETCEWSDVRRMEKSRSALSCCVVYGLPNLAEYSAPRGTLPLPDVEEDEIE